jgi:hypothetical protein
MTLTYNDVSLIPTAIDFEIPPWWQRMGARMMTSLKSALSGKPKEPAAWQRNSNMRPVDENYVPQEHREPAEPLLPLPVEPALTAKMLDDPLVDIRLVFQRMNYGQYREFCTKTQSDMNKVWAWVDPKTIDGVAEAAE